jgi:steroid 5-alpha reductase family enzyme
MSFTAALILTAVIAVLAKTGAWIWQLRTRNAGMVDAIWAWTLGGLAAVYALCGDAPLLLRLLLALMGGAWGLRLGWHLWVRNHGKPEDWRYAQLRKEWGERADSKMFWFFQFQNLFTLLLAASAFAAVAYRDDMPSIIAIALALMLWVGSILGEGIADQQMERFRANPANKGSVCRDGLWRYSRHPNYFFECLHWAAYVPLALGAPWGWVSLAAPAIMAFLLLKLSGVPMLEAEMIRRKPGYDEYVRQTSALIPLPPKR